MPQFSRIKVLIIEIFPPKKNKTAKLADIIKCQIPVDLLSGKTCERQEQLACQMQVVWIHEF